MSTQTQPYTGSRFSAKTLTMCAIFTALVAVCSQITIPLPIIPINLALFAVYLAGALLGPWRGALSLVVYLLLAAVGVPVMAGFRGGLGNLVGNTGGYVVGYIFAAFFTGLLAVKWGSKFWQLCVAMVLGCAVCYFFGTLWYSILSGTPFFASFSACVVPFLPCDVVKILLAALLASRLRPVVLGQGLLYPTLLQDPRRGRWRPAARRGANGLRPFRRCCAPPGLRPHLLPLPCTSQTPCRILQGVFFAGGIYLRFGGGSSSTMARNSPVKSALSSTSSTSSISFAPS